MTTTVDTNVLVYASDDGAPEHGRAHSLLDHLAAGPDLVEEPRFPEGPIAPQELILQGAGALGDEPIETPNLRYMMMFHYLTIVRDC